MDGVPVVTIWFESKPRDGLSLYISFAGLRRSGFPSQGDTSSAELTHTSGTRAPTRLCSRRLETFQLSISKGGLALQGTVFLSISFEELILVPTCFFPVKTCW